MIRNDRGTVRWGGRPSRHGTGSKVGQRASRRALIAAPRASVSRRNRTKTVALLWHAAPIHRSGQLDDHAKPRWRVHVESSTQFWDFMPISEVQKQFDSLMLGTRSGTPRFRRNGLSGPIRPSLTHQRQLLRRNHPSPRAMTLPFSDPARQTTGRQGRFGKPSERMRLGPRMKDRRPFRTCTSSSQRFIMKITKWNLSSSRWEILEFEKLQS